MITVLVVPKPKLLLCTGWELPPGLPHEFVNELKCYLWCKGYHGLVEFLTSIGHCDPLITGETAPSATLAAKRH